MWLAGEGGPGREHSPFPRGGHGAQAELTPWCRAVRADGVDTRGSLRYKDLRLVAQVAQLVEQRTENPRVGSSTLSLGTNHQPFPVGIYCGMRYAAICGVFLCSLTAA